MNGFAKIKNRQPKENSKRQKELQKNPKKINVIGCNKCHRTNVTLRKAKYSYYCLKCYNELPDKEK